MLQRLVAIAAWAAFCLIAYASLSPLRYRPIVPTSWNVEHFAAFAILGTLFSLAYPRRALGVLLIVLGGAALLEFMQFFTADRHARILDAIEKIAGGGVGILAGRVTLIFDRKHCWFQQ